MGSLDNGNILENTVDNKISTSSKSSRVVRSVDLEAWTLDNKKEQEGGVPSQNSASWGHPRLPTACVFTSKLQAPSATRSHWGCWHEMVHFYACKLSEFLNHSGCRWPACWEWLLACANPKVGSDIVCPEPIRLIGPDQNHARACANNLIPGAIKLKLPEMFPV